MKIYKDDMTIECSTNEFLEIKDYLPDVEEEKAFEGNTPLFDDFNSIIDKFYSSLYNSANYD